MHPFLLSDYIHLGNGSLHMQRIEQELRQGYRSAPMCQTDIAVHLLQQLGQSEPAVGQLGTIIEIFRVFGASSWIVFAMATFVQIQLHLCQLNAVRIFFVCTQANYTLPLFC